MKFSPRLGFSFGTPTAGNDPIKLMQYFKNCGLLAVEGVCPINHSKKISQQDIEKQLQIGETAKKLGLEVGSLSSMNEKDVPTMTANKVKRPDGSIVADKPALRAMLEEQLENTFGVLSRVGSKILIIGPGALDKELDWRKQYDNVIDNMSFCADICKKRGFIMEIEALNTVKEHPGVFCVNNTLAARIARDVNSPACGILYDIYHEYMQTGNLSSLDDENVWNRIVSFHVADAPGRNEPGSGEIDYAKVFKKIWDKGYRGFIGLEHGQSIKTPEQDAEILKRYRAFDAQV
ncbi:MAG TPA: TIM barrel protein [Candidatus Merdousia gallistercoris]|nr:TIM barrel protein [Candidatus Merdousia gallistercoris]